MKKFILAIGIYFTSMHIGWGQSLCNSVIINTGYNHGASQPFTPGSVGNPQMDPYWQIISMPDSGQNNCGMPNFYPGGPSFVINDFTTGNPANDLNGSSAISFQATNALPCNNHAPYDPIIMQTLFCINTADSINISGSVVFDDALCMELIKPDGSSIPIPITIHSAITVPSWERTVTCANNLSIDHNLTRYHASTFLLKGFFTSGVYRINLQLRNYHGHLCSVKLKGTVTSLSGSSSIICKTESECGNSLLSIRKLFDVDQNGQISSGDTALQNWGFNVSTPNNNYPNLLTDSYGYIYLNNLPSTGTVTITDILQPGYSLVAASGAAISGNNLTLTLNGSPLYNVIVLNKRDTAHHSTLTINKYLDNNFNNQLDPGDLAIPNFNFTVQVTGLGSFTVTTNSNGVATVPNLPSTGTVTITETPGPGLFFITATGGNILSPGVVSVTLVPSPTGPPQYTVVFLNSNQHTIDTSCPCPDTVTVTSQPLQYHAAIYPAISSANINLLLNGTGMYTGVRASVVDFKLYARDDQGLPAPACMQCYNDAGSWASINSATLGNTSNLPVMNGLFNNSYQDNREIVFNSSSPFAIHNKPLSLNLQLPGANPIKCCHLFARIIIKVTFRNTDCVECDAYIIGTVSIGTENNSQPFKTAQGTGPIPKK